MRKYSFRTTKLVLTSTLLIVSCGGGSDGPTDSSTDVNIPGADVLPLINAENAESGLKGCLNRALYFNGPHFVSTAESQTITFGDIVSSSATTNELIYTVVSVAEDGFSQVDVDKTSVSSESGMANSTQAYSLDGYTVSNYGSDRANPFPGILDFSLDEDATSSSEIVTGADDSTSTVEDTYIGREQIEIAGQSVAACKVARTIYQDVGDPSFNTSVASTIWYGVGTGLTLKTDSVRYPFSELDRSTTVTTLDSATINSIQIF